MTTFRRVVTLASFQGRRRHLAVLSNRNAEYVLCWANPTQHGYHYEPAISGPHKTRKAAYEAKNRILNPTPPSPSKEKT